MFGKRENKTVGTPAAIKAVILEAMKTHNVVKVQYTSENHETLTRDIEPLYSKGTENLAVWCELVENYRTFHWDKIRSAKKLNRKFNPKERKYI